MLRKITALSALFTLTILTCVAQTATLQGRVKDNRGKALDLVTIAIEGTATGTQTNTKGEYTLTVPAAEDLIVVYTFVGYETQKKTMRLLAGETKQQDISLKKNAATLDEFIKKGDRRDEAGNVQLDVSKAGLLPSTGFGSGVEAMIKTLVGTNNELTSQYNVRGGNFDENLVYVNDFEIYRPYLTRSGQQEGMSFVNADLVSGVNFSVGGFQAKYGDKMSSVLDVSYKRPTEFKGRAVASLLGASLSLEGASENQRLTYLVGVRHKSNQYLLQAQPTKGIYNPSFTDAQTLVNYQFNDRWEMEVIANYARNRFRFIPDSLVSTFGLINKAFQLTVDYEGGEIDQFDSRFAGVSTTYRPNDKLRLKLLASGFQTDEQETYDIKGEYLLGEVETDLGKENFGQTKVYLGTGIVHDYARNYLNVNVANVGHRGAYDGGKHYLQWGLDANVTRITDKLHEWSRRDSAGFTQPVFQEKLELTRFYRSEAIFDYTRYSGFLQDNFHFNDSLGMTLSVGVRFNYSTLNNELLISPRAQFSYKPDWKRNIIFKLAGGLYQQPPFYREMRDLDGTVNQQLRAQKSSHFVAGSDYNFKIGKRPFKFTTEVFYKGMWDLVPYEYDNVRIRYFGQNISSGYAYGGEARLYGDIVKDATSWVSIGIVKTEENLVNDSVVVRDKKGAITNVVYPGYIPRPTDQRFMLGMYFEDYLPKWKNYKMHLNLMYASGLPFGPPDKQRYGDTLRLPAYKRVDIGFSALLLDGEKHASHKVWKSFSNVWLSAEVFNLLGIQNTLSYTWIQDQSSGRTFAVPNRLTTRLINVKLIVDF